MKLLLASGNRKKLIELQRITAPLGVEVVQPADIGGLPECVEDGVTFAANAAKKAREGAQHSGLWTLADDSGLEVDALGGAPGVYSARYAGTHGDDQGNNAKLLLELAEVSDEDRGAAFVCALALAHPPHGRDRARDHRSHAREDPARGAGRGRIRIRSALRVLRGRVPGHRAGVRDPLGR